MVSRYCSSGGTPEILGAAGLILPGLTGIAPGADPAGGVGLALMMVLAATVHVRRREPSAVAFNAALLLALFVAWGGSVPTPPESLADRSESL